MAGGETTEQRFEDRREKAAEERLRILARAAVTQAKGNVEQAYGLPDAAVLKANDAALERALHRHWRSIAVREVISDAFTKMRAEGKFAPLPRPQREERERQRATQTRDWQAWRKSYDEDARTAPQKPTPYNLVSGEMRKFQETNYLNAFLVNGQPIGDCTAAEVEQAAVSKERDARFMRLLISGVPPVGVIRRYRTEDEAASLWKQAEAETTSRSTPSRGGGIQPNSTKLHAACTL